MIIFESARFSVSGKRAFYLSAIINNMYRGLNLTIDLEEGKNFNHYKSIGQDIFSTHRAMVEKIGNENLFKEATLNGSAIQQSWFPQIKADVFISHSSKDINLALCMAGWLKEALNLEAFIDSTVWGYVDNLRLKMISAGVNKDYAASHVHLMLANALTIMIDKTECVIFLNTPNSIKPVRIATKTESPWIYHELSMTSVLRVNKPVRRKLKMFNESTGKLTAKSVYYPVDLSHLAIMDYDEFIQWIKEYNKTIGENALDILYKLKEKEWKI